MGQPDNIIYSVRRVAQDGPSAYSNGSAGGAVSLHRLIGKVTAIDNNTPATLFLVDVPNGNHAGIIRVSLLASSGGANAFESSRCALGQIVIARTTGVNAVATAATLVNDAVATVAAGAALTSLAYSVGTVSGAVGQTNSFPVRATIVEGGALDGNQCCYLAELINAEGSGIVMTAV